MCTLQILICVIKYSHFNDESANNSSLHFWMILLALSVHFTLIRAKHFYRHSPLKVFTLLRYNTNYPQIREIKRMYPLTRLHSSLPWLDHFQSDSRRRCSLNSHSNITAVIHRICGRHSLVVTILGFLSLFSIHQLLVMMTCVGCLLD